MKKDIRNIQATKDLIDRYESITLGEIYAAQHKHRCYITTSPTDAVKYDLTGFGSTRSCVLCQNVPWQKGTLKYADLPNCNKCIHSTRKEVKEATKACTTTSSYLWIHLAETPEDLLWAYRQRAKHLRNLIDKL